MTFRTKLAFLAVIVLTPTYAQAQIKLPIYEEDSGNIKKVVFQEAKARGDFRNGKMLRVTMRGEDEKTIKGILVRVDPAKGRIFLRTEPGAAPIAIYEKDIQHIDKGVIKEVNFTKDYSTPEITPIVIYNGSKKSVSYDAPTLSPGEKSQLIEIENAENELARLNSQSLSQDQVLTTDLAIQAEQLKSVELMNNLLWKRELPGGYANSTTSGTTTYGNYGYNFVPLPNGLGAPNGDAVSTFKPFAYPTNPIPLVRYGPTVLPNINVSPEAMTKARQQLTLAQSRAVYEDGQLVAVILPDQAK